MIKLEKPDVLVIGHHVTSLNMMRHLGRHGVKCYFTHYHII